MNHISDFSSLGGVQTYLCSIGSYDKSNRLFSLRKSLDIYNKNKLIKNLYHIDNAILLLLDISIIHNLILSKKWIFYSFILKLFRKKIIYYEHGIAWHNPVKNKTSYVKRLDKVDTIIVNSFATKKLLEKVYKIKKNIKVLHLPVCLFEEIGQRFKNLDASKYDLINIKNKKPIFIGFIGRLEKHKNPSFLIELSNLLKEKYGIKIKLEFIGDGSEYQNLLEESKKNNLNVKFWGIIRNKRTIVDNWHFAIVPSIREPLGLVQAEMSLMNTLCFSSNIDGIPEMYPDNCDFLKIKMIKESNIIDKNANYQFLPHKKCFVNNYKPMVSDCARKIVELLNNTDKAKTLLNYHRDFINQNFDIKNHSKKLREIIYSTNH